MAEHEPPADLLDKLVDGLHDAMYGDSGTPGSLQEVRRIFIPPVLTALAEWADGALIDPSTWTRVTATEVDGIELCVTHDVERVECADPVGACLDDDPDDCTLVPLHLLGPPLTREDP